MYVYCTVITYCQRDASEVWSLVIGHNNAQTKLPQRQDFFYAFVTALGIILRCQ